MNDLPEEWRDIPDYGGRYQISSHGRVRVWKANGWHLRKLNAATSYLSVSLARLPGERRQRTIYIHRVVALLWLGPRPDLHEVRHLDGDKRNNRIENLTYGTHGENIADDLLHGVRKGSRNGRAKLDEEKVKAIRSLLDQGVHGADLARAFNVSDALITRIKYRRAWKDV
jgi:hypothetical protein